ncbi:MAG: hypothetical protein ABSE84_10075, partial [Isosphaeraceae bacterium]
MVKKPLESVGRKLRAGSIQLNAVVFVVTGRITDRRQVIQTDPGGFLSLESGDVAAPTKPSGAYRLTTPNV